MLDIILRQPYVKKNEKKRENLYVAKENDFPFCRIKKLELERDFYFRMFIQHVCVQPLITVVMRSLKKASIEAIESV